MVHGDDGAVVAAGLRVQRGGRVALDRFDHRFGAGTATAVMGPNGSGKTTLLHALAGLLPPAAGSVRRPPGSTVGYVLQHHRTAWLPITVDEVLRMGRYGHVGLLRPFRSADRRAVAEAAERMAVAGLGSRQFGELSGGQQQRVLVAQALARRPDVLLLDEPVTGLDLPSQQRILDLVAEEATAGRVVVMTTHHLDEARHCGTVILLDVAPVAAGPPDEVLVPATLRAAFGERVLGDHHGHGHGHELLVLDDHGHGEPRDGGHGHRGPRPVGDGRHT